MTAQYVVRQALVVLSGGSGTGGEENGGTDDTDARWGSAKDFTLCVRASRDGPPAPLHGEERPHAIQVSTFL